MLKKVLWIVIFTIAMAYVESAVVVYLREVYYPVGFVFPIVQASAQITLIEIGREAATVVMLYSVAYLAFSGGMNRFAAFMLAFGVWDIFYYLWLYVFIKWPESVFTWDILFLIPLPWIGPVLAPVIVSLSLIAAAGVMLSLHRRGSKFRPNKTEWGMAVAAGLTIILSFVWDYRVVINSALPGKFPWMLFCAGEAVGIAAFGSAWRRSLKTIKQ